MPNYITIPCERANGDFYDPGRQTRCIIGAQLCTRQGVNRLDYPDLLVQRFHSACMEHGGHATAINDYGEIGGEHGSLDEDERTMFFILVCEEAGIPYRVVER